MSFAVQVTVVVDAFSVAESRRVVGTSGADGNTNRENVKCRRAHDAFRNVVSIELGCLIAQLLMKTPVIYLE